MIKWIKNIINLNKRLEVLSHNQMRLSMGIEDLQNRVEGNYNEVKDVKYEETYWSDNHSVIRKIWLKKYNQLINPDTDSYERKYWINAIRRVR